MQLVACVVCHCVYWLQHRFKVGDTSLWFTHGCTVTSCSLWLCGYLSEHPVSAWTSWKLQLSYHILRSSPECYEKSKGGAEQLDTSEKTNSAVWGRRIRKIDANKFSLRRHIWHSWKSLWKYCAIMLSMFCTLYLGLMVFMCSVIWCDRMQNRAFHCTAVHVTIINLNNCKRIRENICILSCRGNSGENRGYACCRPIAIGIIEQRVIAGASGRMQVDGDESKLKQER